MEKDTSKTDGTAEEPESRWQRVRRRNAEWQLRKYFARGLAYGAGTGAISVLVLVAQRW